jgi:hypothetical protein
MVKPEEDQERREDPARAVPSPRRGTAQKRTRRRSVPPGGMAEIVMRGSVGSGWDRPFT